MSKLRVRTIPMAISSYTYHSDIMNRNYDVTVSVPRDYESNPRKKYPALLLTDGHQVFPIALGVANYLADETDVPILVSIGSPLEEGREASYRRRVYEFSPPGWRLDDPFGQEVSRQVAGFCKQEAQRKSCLGGAPKFFEFITAELLPELLEVYRIDADDLGLFGHSAGGFFASWAIFQGDSRFKRFIIASPVMAYGDDEIFRLEKQYAQKHEDLPVRISMSSGAREYQDPVQGPYLEGLGKIVSGQVHFGAMLASREYPSLEVYSEIHQDLGHMDMVAVALARGLRLLYPK